MKAKLNDNDYMRAATALGCSVPAVKAVKGVEAPRGGFLPDDQPTILFERHIFSRRTGGAYDASNPEVSNLKPGGYKGGAAEHVRLAEAVALDRDAALQSASWGMAQIMGFNHAAAGHPTLQGFIDAMYDSEAAQLDAFVAFIKQDGRLLRAIRSKDWPAFAAAYNGPNYAINQYDVKLAAAYRAAGGT